MRSETNGVTDPRTGSRLKRRGSSLLAVVGTLAVIAVLAALYVTIGQADRRVSVTVERAGEFEPINRLVAEYLAGVPGQDRVDMYVEAGPNPNAAVPLRFRREVTDYPWTSYAVLSNTTRDDIRFTPSGNISGLSDTASMMNEATDVLAFRGPSDPWLSSAMPEYVGLSGLPNTITDFESDGRWWSQNQDELLYLDRRGWRHISNFAPNGQFVNLWALRNNFDAEPGLGQDNDQRPRMSELLSLLEWDPNAPGLGPNQIPPVRATFELPYNMGSINPAGVGSAQNPGFTARHTSTPVDNRNRPAFFTNDQRALAIPATTELSNTNPPRLGSDPNYTINNFDFLDYQYADADGDGLLDSRWFELVLRNNRFGNPAEGFDQTSEQRFLLPPSDVRVFIAARAIDLSAMVNVNTATDQLVAPTAEAPLGGGPQELNLRRILTAEDAAGFLSANTAVRGRNESLSLRHLEAPNPPQFAVPGGSPVVPFAPADYFGLDIADRQQGEGLLLGRYSYDAIRRAIDGDGPGGTFVPLGQLQGGASGSLNLSNELVDISPFEYVGLYEDAQNGNDIAPLMPAERVRDSARLRAESFASAAVDTTSGSSLGLFLGTDYRFGQRFFGSEDLSELLTFWGLNDDGAFSRLESVVGGRWADAANTPRWSVLRSNRSTLLERTTHDNWSLQSNTLVADGVVDDETMALLETNARTRLTTISGAAPLRDRPYVAESAREPRPEIEARGLRVGEDYRTPVTRELLEDPATLFVEYATGLMPELLPLLAVEDPFDASNNTPLEDPGDVWRVTASTPYDTLFYGHRGPELALRVAAHMAVNTSDAWRRPEFENLPPVPTRALLLVDDSYRTNLNQAVPPTGQVVSPYQVWLDGSSDLTEGTARAFRFDLGASFGTDPAPNGTPAALLAPDAASVGAGSDERRRAVTVFGNVPHPVLTEAVMVHIYCDVPRAGPTVGLMEDGSENQIDPAAANLPATLMDSGFEQTIDGTRDFMNPDLLMQAFVIQVHNPFDVPIALSDAANRPAFYAEFNGHLIALANYGGPSGVTLGVPNTVPEANDFLLPGQTRNVYVTAHRDTAALNMLWNNIATDYGASVAGEPVAVFFQEMFRVENDAVAGATTDPMRGLLFDPQNPGSGEITDDFTDLLTRSLSPSVRPPLVGDALMGERRFELGEVRLWRRINPNAGLLGDDQLVDRLRAPLDNAATRVDPAFGVFGNDLLPAGPTMVTGTLSFVDGELPMFPNGFLAAFPAFDQQQFIDLGGRGLTAMRFSGIRRPDDNVGANTTDNVIVEGADGAVRTGIIPAWFIELADGGANLQQPLNPTLFGSGGEAISDYNANDYGFVEFEEFINLLGMPVDLRSRIPTLPETPDDKDVTAGIVGSVANGTLRVWHDLDLGSLDVPATMPMPRTSGLVHGSAALNLNMSGEPQVGAFVAPRQLRLTDLLLGLGVGGSYSPIDPTMKTMGAAEIVDGEWVTPTMALAAALGYEPEGYYDTDRSLGNAEVRTDNGRPRQPFYSELMRSDGSGEDFDQVLDHGRLRLDDFVAFYDGNATDGQFQPAAPNHLVTATDYTVGPAIPIAMRLLDGFESLPGPNGDEGSVTGVRFGKVNINTMDLSVMRAALPSVSPSVFLDAARTASSFQSLAQAPGSSFAEEDWIQRGLDRLGGAAVPRTDSFGFKEQLGIPDPYDALGGVPTWARTPDIAATFAAYRDRALPAVRSASNNSLGRLMDFRPGAGNQLNNAAYTITGQDLLTLKLQNFPVGNVATAVEFDSARALSASIPGLRSTPGFAARAEILAATIADPERLRSAWEKGLQGPGGSVDTAVNQRRAMLRDLRHLTPQFYGTDHNQMGANEEIDTPRAMLAARSVNNSPDAIVPAQPYYRNPEVPTPGNTQVTAWAPPTAMDAVANDYDEKLAIAASLFDSIDVRSDYFAIWYIIRAYRESDVADLADTDPMTPSYEKRFLMVIDRSNVTEQGELPRIVFNREVPL